MFGRFNEVDDKPDWREKLAAWRDSPLFVFERPEWLREGPGVLFLLFAGIASLMAAIVYVAIPPGTLPASVPGHFNVVSAAEYAASSSTTISTTTTTAPKTAVLKTLELVKKMTPEGRKSFWAWVEAAAKYNRDQAAQDVILSQPPTPPTRLWAYSFLAAVLSALLLAAAWFTSETRSRRIWGH